MLFSKCGGKNNDKFCIFCLYNIRRTPLRPNRWPHIGLHICPARAFNGGALILIEKIQGDPVHKVSSDPLPQGLNHLKRVRTDTKHQEFSLPWLVLGLWRFFGSPSLLSTCGDPAYFQKLPRFDSAGQTNTRLKKPPILHEAPFGKTKCDVS